MSRLLCKSRRAMRVGAVVAVMGGAAIGATPAAALYDAGSCWTSSGQVCQLSGYHGWYQIAYGGDVSKPEMCAKAVTAAGNIRSGSGCIYPGSWTLRCLSGASPNSSAYGYWGGSGSAITGQTQAWSPSEHSFCG